MGVGFQGPKGEFGLPGPRGRAGPPGKGAPLTGGGETIVGPPGDKGQLGEKVGVDNDNFLCLQINVHGGPKS